MIETIQSNTIRKDESLIGQNNLSENKEEVDENIMGKNLKCKWSVKIVSRWYGKRVAGLMRMSPPPTIVMLEETDTHTHRRTCTERGRPPPPPPPQQTTIKRDTHTKRE